MIQLRHILVATDLSDSSERVYSYAEALARCFEAEFHIIHVRGSDQPASIGTIEVETLPEAKIARQRSLAPGLASSVHTWGVIEGESIPEPLVKYARACEVDLIVMGGRGPSGLRMPRLGSVARHVVNHAPCPVLTVRHAFPTHGLRRILVPVDFSESSRRTLNLAKRMADQFRSQIDLLHVIEPANSSKRPPTGAGLGPDSAGVDEVETRLNNFWMEVEGPAVPYEARVRQGPIAPGIINYSLERSCNLILIGTHGHTGRQSVPMGSVAERVATNALCATLTVRSFPSRQRPERAKQAARSTVPA